MGKKLGNLIRAARTDAGLTQEQLAKKVDGATQSDIGRFERGEAEPTQQVVKNIAKACGVTQKSLLDAMPKTASRSSSTTKPTAKTTAKTTKTASKSTASKSTASKSTAKTVSSKSASTKTTTAKPASAKSTASKSTTAKAASTKSASTSEKYTMSLTATEKRLVELYRAADSETKKKALSLLRGTEDDAAAALPNVNDIIGAIIEGVLK